MTDREYDPWEDPGWKEYEAHAKDKVIPMIKGAAISLALLTETDPDPKQALELGYMVLFDKPIIVVVNPGVKVPEKLVRAADEIVEGADMTDPDFRERLTAAIERTRAKVEGT